MFTRRVHPVGGAKTPAGSDMVSRLADRMRHQEENRGADSAAQQRSTDTRHMPLDGGATPTRLPAAPDRSTSAPAPERAEDNVARFRAPGTRMSTVLRDLRDRVIPVLLERVQADKVVGLDRRQIGERIDPVVAEIVAEIGALLNATEHQQLVRTLVDELVGLGPLEPLLADPDITDIMVNGPGKVYIERDGKISLTDVTLRNDAHVMHIATRIATAIGRRVDATQPMVDARLADGSRVNIIVPPLAIDGPCLSIRRFGRTVITLDDMAARGNMSQQMATFLKVAARSRLNVLISGGTGSGKTTLLNALSQLIDERERIVTIEDAAELQLQQSHTVRLETRPANIEGGGELTMQDLLRNALRMRPDRIILGEVRGAEAVDLLQAMNTGHDGSLSTIHANRPREAITRLENMVAMSGITLPSHAVRGQISEAVDLIVQVQRMRDGVRRVTNIMEVVGMEGPVVTGHEIFTYEFDREDDQRRFVGRFVYSGVRPQFVEKARYFGIENLLLKALSN